ncbi:MAG: zinc dependent phospholipase C family protein [Treponema sp.]|jgi:hypothetical protein|nr:zinc dependent phospholipase C family protein [Treponema sp.]
MKLEIHYRIAKKISGEIKGLGFKLNEKSFLLGNLFPDLIQSYVWRRHEYSASREYFRKKMSRLTKKPLFFSFQLGELTHYICDYFCYPHSRVYNKNILHHILYEINQKVPKNLFKLNVDIKFFAIEELDKFVGWYENFRPLFEDSCHDFHIASLVSSWFIQAGYKAFFNKQFKAECNI